MTTRDMSYTIDASLLGQAEARIAKANRKAEARGSDLRFSMTAGPVHRERRSNGSVLETVTITVTAPVIDLGGWSVVGVADMLSSGADGHAVVRRVGAQPLPEQCWSVDDTCEHCGYRRKRKVVFVLRRDAEFIRVGSGCLDQFVPKADLGLARELEALLAWGNAIAAKRKEPLPEEARYLVIDLLAFGLVSVARDGGFRRERRTGFDRTTAEIAMEYWQNRLISGSMTGIDADTFQDAVEDATIIADWCMTLDRTEYERNLHSIFEQALLTRDELWKHDRLIVSAIRAYRYQAEHGEAAFRREMDRIEVKRTPKVDTATWMPLRSGDFGVRVVGTRPTRGQIVEVVSKAGRVSSVTIARVIWSSDDDSTHICAVSEEVAA